MSAAKTKDTKDSKGAGKEGKGAKEAGKEIKGQQKEARAPKEARQQPGAPKEARENRQREAREAAEPKEQKERRPERPAPVPRLQIHYRDIVVKQLMEQFGYKTAMQVPRLPLSRPVVTMTSSPFLSLRMVRPLTTLPERARRSS